MKNRLRTMLALALFGATALGQAPPAALVKAPVDAAVAKLPVYEVASVREDKSDSGMTSFNGTPSGIRISGAPMVNLLKDAYGLYDSTDDQVIGLPPWAKAERFDIDAKVANEDVAAYRKLTREQRAAMLQAVLEDRFQLKAHHETNDGPVYNLVLGKHGSKLTVTNPEVTGAAGSHVSGCKQGCMSSNNGHLEAKGVEIKDIAAFLTDETQRTVIDKTGLTGKYDFTLDWTSLRWGPKDATNQPGAPPEIFTAVQEQLGLRLEAGKGPVESVVVDHIEEPSAN
jgi:uncharacterized protein (TIGR03435 family)